MASLLTATVPQQMESAGDEQFIPAAADWEEFCAWADTLDRSGQAFPDEPEATADEWAGHVRSFLAEHNLAELPF